MKKAFTLVEVLLVVVIISILAAIVIIAVNPARQISQTNNTQRKADVQTVLNAIHQSAIDNRGALPSAISTTETTVATGVGNVDICDALVPKYIAEMPYDPTDSSAKWTSCSDYNTGYKVKKDDNGRVTVTAPSAELSETISVTR